MKKQLIIIMIDSLRWDTFNSDYFSGFKYIRRDFNCFSNAWCGSFGSIPCRADVWLGELSFLKRPWGPLNNDAKTLPQLLSRNGIPTALITDNHILVNPQCGGNFQKDFTFYDFIRGHESDNWSFEEPSEDLPEYDFGTRDRNYWTQYRRNYTRHKRHGTFTIDGMINTTASFLSNFKETDFYLWIDCFFLHEPWCPGSLSVSRDIPASVLYPKYTSECDVDEYTVNMIKQCYNAQSKLVSNWSEKILNIIYDYLNDTNINIILLTDHGFCIDDFMMIGKPKNAPCVPPLSKIVFATKLQKQYSYYFTKYSFIQPHLLSDFVSIFFDLKCNNDHHFMDFLIWGRNSIYSNYISVALDDMIIFLSRNNCDNYVLPIDKYTSKRHWKYLNRASTLQISRAKDILCNFEDSLWIKNFLNN